MKCSNCGHVSHGMSACAVSGCDCDGGESVEMSARELSTLSMGDLAAALAVVPPAEETPAAPGTPTSVDAPTPGEDDDATPTTPDPTDGIQPDNDTPDAAMSGPTGPRFLIPVGLIEDMPTSDGRKLSAGATTWRTPPLPLMGLDQTTFEHQQAEIVGRVDEIVREGNVISAAGVFLGNERGLYFAGLVGDQFIKGVSADLTDVIEEMVVTAFDDDGFPAEVGSEFTQARIAGFTICPFPAFEGAYIVLAPEEGEVAPPPPTLEKPTPEQAAAGMYVLATENRCSSCDDTTPVVASAGPMRPPRAWFEDPGLDGPTRLTIDDDGRIFGHLAVFGTCHIGFQGKCVQPFSSKTGYSQFTTGSVLTAEGDLVASGVITMDTGHADVSSKLTAADVRAHYDNTGAQVADVAMGHDEYGIWIAGAMRPDVSELQVRKLRGSALSGDWRWIGSGMEVVAALAVNVPGFPIPRAVAASGHPVALVAAGALPLAKITEAANDGTATDELVRRLAVLERIAALSIDGARANLRARMASLS